MLPVLVTSFEQIKNLYGNECMIWDQSEVDTYWAMFGCKVFTDVALSILKTFNVDILYISSFKPDLNPDLRTTIKYVMMIGVFNSKV